MILFGGDDECLLRGLKIVADLIDEYVHLGCTYLGGEAAQEN